MCGIAGFNWVDKNLAETMAQQLAHRGPDDCGVWCDENVSLSHRRLTVLDLSEKGRQPMAYGNLHIVFNGEIYNFQDLRSEFEKTGDTFRTGTDTEVILHAYQKKQAECVNDFNGMWAFCIYDADKRRLFLSRDRFGKKPLYYYYDGKRFIFSSELKAIRLADINLEIDAEGLNQYFYQKYIPGEYAIYKNIRKLPPGCNLIFDISSHQIQIGRYYFLENQIQAQREISLEQRLNSIEPLLCDAVEKRLIADVPVGSFLSGGVDSSLISALIAKKHNNFKTFSIGFKSDSFDESPYARKVAEHIGTDHYCRYMEIDEELIRNVIGRLDEPFGDSSILPTYLLSKMTRQTVTVALSGDAGDEVFGGYDSYLAYKYAKFVPACCVKSLAKLTGGLKPSDSKLSWSFKIGKFFNDFDANIEWRHLNWMSTFNDESRGLLLGDAFIPADRLFSCGSGRNLLTLQLNDIHNYLAEDILKKVDTASMMNSLEVRTPFLDYRLVPLVLSLPENYLIRGFTGKWLLKKIAAKFLTAEIVDRKKRGFTVPISQWLRQSDFMRQVLAGREFYEHNLVNYNYVRLLLDGHLARKQDNARKLWLVFVLNWWRYANSR